MLYSIDRGETDQRAAHQPNILISIPYGIAKKFLNNSFIQKWFVFTSHS
jgi:hypothetical protein